MSDNVDDANALADLHLNIALAKRDLPAPRAVTGVCHWCEAPVDGVVFVMPIAVMILSVNSGELNDESLRSCDFRSG